MRELFNRKIGRSIIYKLFGIILLLALTTMLMLFIFKEAITDPKKHTFFVLIIAVEILFTLAAFFIHRILQPVYELRKGVKEISKGNLEVQLKVRSKDELGELAEAFNQMTKDLKSMIKAREQLLLDVSHELRTPITRSKLALEMLPESEKIKSVQNDLKEMELMISELLESERLKNGYHHLKKSTIYIKNLIDEVILEYSNTLPGIKVHIISEKLNIEGDPKLIKTLLRNIIDNALKYSLPNSKPIDISVIDNSSKITIIIEDSGPGIHEGELSYIFDPFYRADKSRSKKTGGYGLGLHLCQRIMEAHNGKIRIKNKENSNGLIVELEFANNKINSTHP